MCGAVYYLEGTKCMVHSKKEIKGSRQARVQDRKLGASVYEVQNKAQDKAARVSLTGIVRTWQKAVRRGTAICYAREKLGFR